MSWFDTLEVRMATDEVRIARRGLLSRGGPEQVQFVSEGDRAKATSGEPWVSSVQCLARALAAAGRGGAAVEVVLADPFVRYALVPWNRDLVSDAERQALAAASFKQLFGAMADRWQVTVDEQPAGKASFACAVDRALIESVRELCKGNRMRLRSVQPFFAQRFNRNRHRITPPTCWVGSLDAGRLTLAMRSEGNWTGIRTVRTVENSTAELATVLRQESAALGAALGGPLFLMGREEMLREIGALPGWNIVRMADGKESGKVPVRAAPRGTPSDDQIKEAS